MSLSIVIIKFSKQLASFQAEPELLRIGTEAQTERGVLKNRKSKKPNGTKISLLKSIRRLEQEHYEMLFRKYRDEIEFIRKRCPDWEPEKKLFDIQG
jgi:hypothetical protein